MKILFLSDDFPPQSFGGAGISTFELATGMKKEGHEVFVITTIREEDKVVESDYYGLQIFKIVSSYPERWRAYLGLCNPMVVWKVKKLLSQIRPDVVHANNIHYYLSYYSLKLAKKYAKAVVFTARDTMAFSYGKLATKHYIENFNSQVTWLDNLKFARKRWNPFRNSLISKYLSYVDKIFALSNDLKKSLQNNGIKNVEVMYTGIDTESWLVSEEETRQFKKKYDLEGKKVILFGGRLSEAKGGRKALEMLVRVSKEIPNSVLLVAGSKDTYANAMLDQAKTAGLQKQLIFTGWIDRNQIKLVYAVADVVLVPSLYLDAFPRLNLEAMASAKPVVGTCYGGTPEAIEDGVTGYVVNPFKVEEIAEKITDLLKHDDKAEKFGRAGLERVKANFNLKDKVAKHIAIYEKLS